MKNLFTINEEEKNRILNLHETATKRHYLREQKVGSENNSIINTDHDNAYDYKFENGKYYFKGKDNTEYGDKYPDWREAKADISITNIKKVFDNEPDPIKKPKTPIKKTVVPIKKPKTPIKKTVVPIKKPKTPIKKTSQNFCPAIPSSKGVDPSKMGQYQSIGGSLISKGVPQRSACEISYVKIRPKFNNKSFFVVDTKDNNIYLFNKQGEFVAKSYTIDGLNAQSQDAKSIAKALWSWDEYTKASGFEWDGTTQKYKDKTSKGRIYNNDLIYDYIDKNKSRFFPKGIYSIDKLKSDNDYVGGDDNIFNVTTLDGKVLSNAIHGFYNEPPRVRAMQQLKKAMGSHSSPTDKNIPDEFIKTVEQYLGTSKFNKSYGCINLPTDFLTIAKPYAVGSMVFVIGETDSNYLVQNDKFFGDMGGDSQQCPNPESLGEILPTIDAVA